VGEARREKRSTGEARRKGREKGSKCGRARFSGFSPRDDEKHTAMGDNGMWKRREVLRPMKARRKYEEKRGDHKKKLDLETKKIRLCNIKIQ